MEQHLNSDKNSPVLLAGLPRSGTTWVGKLIDSHPDVLYRHEPDSWCKDMLKKVPLICDDSIINEYHDSMAKFVDLIPSINASKVAGKQPVFAKSYLSTCELLAYRATIGMSKVGGRVIKNFPAYLYSLGNKDYRLVWKSIDALGRINLISSASPKTKMLHLVRHPCGYVASVIRGSQRGRFESSVATYDDEEMIAMLIKTSFAKQRGLTLEYIISLSPVERLAWIWLLFNDKARIDGESIQGYKLFNYQDICANPIEELKNIYNAVGLSWESQTEDFVRASTTTNKDEYYSIVKDPLISSLKWKSELTTNEIDKVMEIVSKSIIGKLFIAE